MKLTKKTLKQIIKEETQKALHEDERLEIGLDYDPVGIGNNSNDEKRVQYLIDKFRKEQGIEIDDDDSSAPAKELKLIKQIHGLFKKRLEKERDERTKAKNILVVAWEKAKDEGKIQDWQDEFTDMNRWAEEWNAGAEVGKLSRTKQARAEVKMEKTKNMMRVLAAKAKEQKMAVKALMQKQKDMAQAKAQQVAAQKEEDKKGATWVGKSRREVLQALQDEFKIRPTRNWYKKLPVRHPARVKFREWYKASRGR